MIMPTIRLIMTLTNPSEIHATTQSEATPRRGATHAMTPPIHFTVSYAINRWMNPDIPVDTDLAVRNGNGFARPTRALAHCSTLVDAQPGLPDMVYAANGGLQCRRLISARFAFPNGHPKPSTTPNGLRCLRARPCRTEGVQEGGISSSSAIGSGGHGLFRTDRDTMLNRRDHRTP